ncbi:YncE family protein [Sporanaerobacter acetigenes]|uniref:40-residue YVTN family beta-propeller repeat-containing protein n=1 Tax=Sporanaerobacter acetigenes DSM 13106 TaxID=1123281 RepID=A0A1M5WSQ9_9FIRM|nr:hypothetical protein [Sporanaerobacter acetigenes]SHH90646.1 40-residue YVTN family beta-propeller repeat-containing protein [Sporanaerobacter acetigenes DSM 13106]
MEWKVIVANTGEDSIGIIDLQKKLKCEIVSIISLFKRENNLNIYLDSYQLGPYDLCVGSYRDKIYLTNAYDNSIFKIDINNKKIDDRLAVGRFPSCIRVYNELIFVSNSDSNSISIVDEKSFKLIENIPVGENPEDIEIDRLSKKIYVANNNGHSINIIDLKKDSVEKIKLDKNPVKIYLEDESMYMLSRFNNGILNNSNISVLDIKDFSIVKSINIKGTFNNMLKINNKDIVYITSLEDGYLHKIDIKDDKIVSKKYIGGMPNKMLWIGPNILFIVNIFQNHITIFDIVENKIIKNIEVGLEPNGLIIF